MRPEVKIAMALYIKTQKEAYDIYDKINTKAWENFLKVQDFNE